MDKDELKSLLARLNDSRLDYRERRDITRAIIDASGDVREELIKALEDEQEWRFKVELLNLIGATRDPLYEDSILKTLQSEAREEVLQSAATNLGKLGSARAFSTLIDLLNHHSPNVRLGAIYGLISLGDRRAVPFLARKLNDRTGVRCWWPSPKGDGYKIDREAALAIDAITGEPFRGDEEKIRQWVELHLA